LTPPPVGAGRALRAIWGLGLLCGCASDGPPVRIRVSGNGVAAPCAAEIGGRRIDPESLTGLARRWRGREAQVTGSIDTPYRCVGHVIYALQRAGFTRIGFIIEPARPPAE
jgi:biopolymer transport protein ExbD